MPLLPSLIAPARSTYSGTTLFCTRFGLCVKRKTAVPIWKSVC